MTSNKRPETKNKAKWRRKTTCTVYHTLHEQHGVAVGKQSEYNGQCCWFLGFQSLLNIVRIFVTYK